LTYSIPFVPQLTDITLDGYIMALLPENQLSVWLFIFWIGDYDNRVGGQRKCRGSN